MVGLKFTQSGFASLETKKSAILNLTAPRNLKQLQSLFRPVHYLVKIIPNLSQLCQPFRPLLKKNTKNIWNNELETHFQHIKNKVANATENTRLEIRDASRGGLRAALEQQSPTGWHTVAFPASRFLNSNEERYSVKELNYFEWCGPLSILNIIFEKSFTIITDHRALLSIMKEYRSNKSYNSRLTHWVDRLSPFDFNIEHKRGAKMRLVDYISRQPHQKAKVTNQYMMRKWRLQQLPAFVTPLQQFI